MDNELLRFLIREIIQEVRDNARVGDQLRNSDGSPESGEEEEEVDETSGAGAIAGMTLPLGMATPGKKKKPGWK
jgi:hypothetical protein